MAAGLSMEEEKVERLRRCLNERTELSAERLEGKRTIDLQVPFAYVSEERIDEIQLLEPYGPGNPPPLFAVRNVTVCGAQKIGREKSFMKLFLQDEDGIRIEALCFQEYDKFRQEMIDKYGIEEFTKLIQRKPNSVRLSVAYDMDINEYMGMRMPQIIIRDYIML